MPFDTGGQDGKGIARVDLDPARVGGNDMHVYVQRPNGKAFDVPEVKVAFTLKAKDIGPLPVVPDRIATGHWTASGVQIPVAGNWQISVTRADLRHRPGDRGQERADRLNDTMAEQSTPESLPVQTKHPPGRAPEAAAEPPGSPGAASENAPPERPFPRRPLQERHFAPPLLGTAGATGLALGAAGGAAGYAAAPSADRTALLTRLGADEVMFHGKHQPGITTALQARGHLVAFDLAPGAGRKDAAALLRRWSTTAERLMAGRGAGRATRTSRSTPGPPP